MCEYWNSLSSEASRPQEGKRGLHPNTEGTHWSADWPAATPVRPFVLGTSLDACHFLTPTDNKHPPRASLAAPLNLFCFICSGRCRQIVVFAEAFVGRDNNCVTTQHKFRNSPCEIKPSNPQLLILQMCKVITNKHFFFSSPCFFSLLHRA